MKPYVSFTQDAYTYVMHATIHLRQSADKALCMYIMQKKVSHVNKILSVNWSVDNVSRQVKVMTYISVLSFMYCLRQPNE